VPRLLIGNCSLASKPQLAAYCIPRLPPPDVYSTWPGQTPTQQTRPVQQKLAELSSRPVVPPLLKCAALERVVIASDSPLLLLQEYFLPRCASLWPFVATPILVGI
jgi:hypothetical protein